MSTAKTLQIDTASSEDSERLGRLLAEQLRGGEVLELVGDLGSGKTTLVRGVAVGAGSTDRVASPTFTISKVYKTPKFTIHHFDFYRLADPGLAVYELQDLLADPEIVVITEWAEILQDTLPVDRLTIQIERTGDDSRQITLSCPDNLGYLIEGLS